MEEKDTVLKEEESQKPFETEPEEQQYSDEEAKAAERRIQNKGRTNILPMLEEYINITKPTENAGIYRLVNPILNFFGLKTYESKNALSNAEKKRDSLQVVISSLDKLIINKQEERQSVFSERQRYQGLIQDARIVAKKTKQDYQTEKEKLDSLVSKHNKLVDGTIDTTIDPDLAGLPSGSIEDLEKQMDKYNHNIEKLNDKGQEAVYNLETFQDEYRLYDGQYKELAAEVHVLQELKGDMRTASLAMNRLLRDKKISQNGKTEAATLYDAVKELEHVQGYLQEAKKMIGTPDLYPILEQRGVKFESDSDSFKTSGMSYLKNRKESDWMTKLDNMEKHRRQKILQSQ